MNKCISLMVLGLLSFCQSSFSASADSILFVSTKNDAWYVADPFFNKCENPQSKCGSIFAKFGYYYIDSYYNGARIEASTNSAKILGLRLRWTGRGHEQDNHIAYLNFYKLLNNNVVSCNVLITQRATDRPEQLTIHEVNGPCRVKQVVPATFLELELD